MAKPRKPLLRLAVWLVLIFLLAFVFLGPELFPGNSKLYDAIEAGDVSAARAILASGNDPDSRSRGLDTNETERYRYKPLEYALRYNEPEIARLLVAAGADPNQKTHEGTPVLIKAVDAEMVEVVRILIEKGADVQATGSFGETALHFGDNLARLPKDYLDPVIRAILEEAGAQ